MSREREAWQGSGDPSLRSGAVGLQNSMHPGKLIQQYNDTLTKKAHITDMGLFHHFTLRS
jgi:hypothetical protein